MTDEVLKEPPPATPQITVAVAGANGRTSTLASEELAETVFTGMDANSKLALLQGTSPSQISQVTRVIGSIYVAIPLENDM